jgi:sterol desaturase/sphingolipid hydroxylase (fatty acid hydroxylase superfamily)
VSTLGPGNPWVRVGRIKHMGDETSGAKAVVTQRRRLYPWTFVLAAVTAWLAWRGVTTLQRGGELARTLAGARHELAGPAVIGFVVLALVLERLWPRERRPLLAQGHVQDAMFFILSCLLIVPLVTLLSVGSASVLTANAPWLEVHWVDSWPRPAVVLLTLILMDGCNWLSHLAEHRVGILWRVHAVHHSQEQLSVLTTFRTHPLVHTLSFFAATVPVIVLTGSQPLAPVLITVYLCLGAFPHANVGWTFGPLGKVIVSPAYHRIHHAADGPYDVNLGIVLPWWDMLAGRAVFPEPGAPAFRTGLADRPLRVEQAVPRRRGPLLLAHQLIEPFTRGDARGARPSVNAG